MNDPVNIIFLLGLSGTGKTSIGEHMASHQNWLHLDLDPINGEGLEKSGLSRDWLEFKSQKNSKPIIEELTSRYKAANKAGIIVTFSSTRIVESDVIESVKGRIKIFYLSGTKDHCLNSFLEREKTSSRNLDSDHWIKFNDKLLNFLSRRKIAPYKIETFKTTGQRRPIKELLHEISVKK